MRHQRTHSQTNTPAPFATPPSTTSFAALPSDVEPSNDQASSLPGVAFGEGDGPVLRTSHGDSVPTQTVDFPDIGLDLMWPDSEDLFQSILSSDLGTSWQLPPGTLPLPSRGLTPENSVAITIGASTAGQLLAGKGVQSGDNQHAVHGVSAMVSNFSSSLTAAVESAAITSVFLDQCLHMFFDRFIASFPIMHRPTFVYRDCSSPLLLNAIAMGSLYLGPRESIAKGELLWRLAHTAMATSWQSLITHRGPYDACSGVQLVLAALLSVIYGALSKDTAIRGASQALHASAFFWARQCGIFESTPYDLTELPAVSASQDQKMHHWKTWVAREIQKRALMSHYMLDGLIAHMQGNSTSVRHTSNTLRLPSFEGAFQCTSVDQWLRYMHTIQQHHHSFRDVYKQLFVDLDPQHPVQQSCSNLCLRVLLEGVQSIIADSDSDDGAIINPPDRSQISYALCWIYDSAQNSADISDVERLEVLLRWHAVCLEAVAKTPQLCNYICTHWNVQQGLWPNRNLRDQNYNLPDLVSRADGRKALLHATAIQNIVEHLPSGRAHAVHTPSSLFAAATIYGVYAFTGAAHVRYPSVIDWKDVARSGDDFVTGQSETIQYVTSGHISLQYATTTSKNVFYELNSVQKHFRSMATQWGIASDMERVIGQWIAFGQS